MSTVKIVNLETGQEIEREMNTEELAQLAIDESFALGRKEAETQKATDKAALLEKLGITQDEAKLLLS